MLKMFHRHESAGSSAAYWEDMWGRLDASTYALQAKRHCEGSPLWRLITRKVQYKRLFIDGGCGHGYWVKYLHDLGQRAAGVDFADNTLRQIRRIDPSLDIRVGDVRALPFENGEVHVYYSGGVVEHFEDGPIAALAEARRVIAPDGWLLCSVPDVSPLRKHILYRAATETRGIENGDLFVRRASQMAKDRGDEASAGDPTFFQYVFEEREFREHLKATGFEVVETFGESMLWGLLEVVPIRHLCEGATLAWRTVRPRRTDEHGGASTAAASNGNGRGGLRSSLRAMPRRLLLNEDRTIPILGPMLSVAVELTANLRMYVARPS